MHFVILGAGALGSLLAACLVRDGHRVQLVARGQRAKLLAADGLRIEGLLELRARCEIVEDPAVPDSADIFVNTVKTYDSAAGLAALSRLRPGLAFSVQNGVIKEAELAARFGAAQVMGAMADFSGELTDNGAVTFTRNINLHLGELDGPVSPRAQELAAVIHAAGINARPVADIRTLIWSKYTGWLALMLMAVLTRRYTGDYLRDPDVARVAVRLVREASALAASLGIPLADGSPMPVSRICAGSEDDALDVVQEVGARMHGQAPTHRLSALQDLLRGRRLELEETVGYALAEGRARGLSMPTLETCYRIVAGINHGQG